LAGTLGKTLDLVNHFLRNIFNQHSQPPQNKQVTTDYKDNTDAEIPLFAERLQAIFTVKCRDKSLKLSRDTMEEHADDTTKNKNLPLDLHNTGINDNL
jgi:hypothetical protein